VSDAGVEPESSAGLGVVAGVESALGTVVLGAESALGTGASGFESPSPQPASETADAAMIEVMNVCRMVCLRSMRSTGLNPAHDCHSKDYPPKPPLGLEPRTCALQMRSTIL